MPKQQAIPASPVTRGRGRIEHLLARRRAARAEKLIPPSHRHGRVLDIGCGSYPYFLSRTAFARKIGLDKIVSAPATLPAAGGTPGPPIELLQFDLHAHDRLPFEDASIEVVTMLAVFEHIRPDRLVALHDEIARVLVPGGLYVMTTPAGWTAPVLWVLKQLGLVSAVEIDEHQASYSRRMIRDVLGRSRLAGCETRMGSFECGLNTWAVVVK